MAKVASLPCCVCGYWPVEIHHLALRASNYDTHPLCADITEQAGTWWLSLPGKRLGRKKFGYQRDLLNFVLNGMRATTAGIRDLGVFRGKEGEKGEEGEIGGQED